MSYIPHFHNPIHLNELGIFPISGTPIAIMIGTARGYQSTLPETTVIGRSTRTADFIGTKDDAMMNTKAPYPDCDDAMIAWLVDEALRPGSRFHADLFADGDVDDRQDESELEDVGTLQDQILSRAREVA